MSRLSREQKRELKRQRSTAGAGGQPTAGMTPIEVHVPASADAAVAPGSAGVRGCATVGGMPVVAAPGETVQGAILNYLHRLALATGHPVLASIHDERIGFVVPLQVHVDGSSRYTAEPVRVAPPAPPVQPREPRPEGRPHLPPQEHRHTPPEGHPHPPAHTFTEPPPHERRPQPPVRDQRPEPPAQRRPEVPAPPLPPVPVSAEPPVHASEVPEVPEAPAVPRRDKATFLLRAVPEPPARPLPGPETGTPSAPVTTSEAVPAPAPEYPPMAPPAPEPSVRPESVAEPRPAPVRRPEPAVTAEFVPQPQPQPQPQSQSQPQSVRPASPESVPATAPAPMPAPVPAPAPAAMAEPVVTADPGRGAGAGAGPANGGAVAPVPGPDQVPAADPAVPGTPTPSTFVLRAVPEPKPLPGAASTRVLRAVPESAAAAVPAPTGEFGPAPVTGPAPEPERAPEPKAAAPERKPASAMEALSLLGPEPEPDPKPTPARGFDAVAEAVLAPSPQEPAAERDAASAFLAEPVARINEAVKMGRIEAAAGMAERAVAEAAQSLGQEHPEVLKLRELTAYIAYLAGDALRSFHLSLDLARVRRRHRDSGAAYGNVQSAAAAWRAVRDPLQGLHLGRDLIGLWTELAADDGPAADDLEQLESARTRMVRLAERARLAADNPYARAPRAHGE
uniref:Tetratricopeptide repeat protein n=1 Tax=Streptomyces sp. NBC_01393 TaxID=2903851 RepID=A0AAU3II36_9ACTN